MEVAPGIHRIDAPLGDRICGLYLLVGDDAALLVDTGVAGTIAAHLLPYAARIGLDPARVRLVLVSHADVDHSGDTAAAKDAFPRALLACHRDDADEVGAIEAMVERRYRQFAADHGLDEAAETIAWFHEAGRSVPVDLQLTGGERLRLGPDRSVEIVHVPGHSRGHLAVWDPRSRTAVIADAALWRTVPTAAGAPAFPPTYRYADAYLGSIARIEALRPELLLTSHYPTMRGEAAAAFLAESRAYAERVDAVLLDDLKAKGPATTRDLLARVGPRLGPWPVERVLTALAFPVMGHLERLEGLGAVRRRQGGDGPVVWEPAS